VERRARRRGRRVAGGPGPKRQDSRLSVPAPMRSSAKSDSLGCSLGLSFGFSSAGSWRQDPRLLVHGHALLRDI